jgi:hypothetical protein
MNNGYSSRLIYDECAYQDRLHERTEPLLYRLSPNQIHNCDQCLSTLGPRSSYMGQGVSTTTGHGVATAQYLTDVESVLTNRNVPASKCKNGEMNSIDVTKFGLKHLRTCNGFLDPMATHLSYPPFNIREMPTNRFHNLPQNPQEPIFYNFAANTKLEGKDNFTFRLNKLKSSDPTSPTECVLEGKDCSSGPVGPCAPKRQCDFAPRYASRPSN